MKIIANVTVEMIDELNTKVWYLATTRREIKRAKLFERYNFKGHYEDWLDKMSHKDRNGFYNDLLKLYNENITKG